MQSSQTPDSVITPLPRAKASNSSLFIMSYPYPSWANYRHLRNLWDGLFTNAAISELQERLLKERLLPHSIFPHFVGTFDSFIWHYLVEPFGLNGCDKTLSLIPDTGELLIKPYDSAQELPLYCFDRLTGQIIPDIASKFGFTRNASHYDTIAKRLRETLHANGHLDHEDVRRMLDSNFKCNTLIFSESLQRG